MPIEPSVLDAHGRSLPLCRADGDDEENDNPGGNVHPVKARDDKKARAEMRDARKDTPPKIVSHRNVETCFLLPALEAETAHTMDQLLAMSVNVMSVM